MTPRVMIAAVRSGSGKTSIATGLMGALAQRGLQVQGFKVGPDFIDPSYHSAVTGRPSRNLDTWMLSYSQVRRFFYRAAATADISVIEGVMGLFDGLQGSRERGSSAEVGRLLGCPVLLILDVHSQARSAVVEYLGVRALDPELALAGVILNRVQGPRHLEMLRDCFAGRGIPIYGAVATGSLPHLSERHLGLVPVPERKVAQDELQQLIEAVADQIDLDRIVTLAKQAPAVYTSHLGERFTPGRIRALMAGALLTTQRKVELPGDGKLPDGRLDRKAIKSAAGKICTGGQDIGGSEGERAVSVRDERKLLAAGATGGNSGRGKAGAATTGQSPASQTNGSGYSRSVKPAAGNAVRIALARDEAFNFYYRDSLDLLIEECGVELVPFSPLHDRELPPGIAGVIIGGGFPELFARELAENQGMRDALQGAHQSGMPILAECGGFMYLCQRVTDLEGVERPMVGLVPGSCRMEKKLAGMGYITARALRPSLLADCGDKLRGHQFHYSTFTPETEDFPWAFTFVKGNSGSRSDGYAAGNLLASYLHLHFAAAPAAARRFAATCRRWSS